MSPTVSIPPSRAAADPFRYSTSQPQQSPTRPRHTPIPPSSPRQRGRTTPRLPIYGTKSDSIRSGERHGPSPCSSGVREVCLPPTQLPGQGPAASRSSSAWAISYQRHEGAKLFDEGQEHQARHAAGEGRWFVPSVRGGPLGSCTNTHFLQRASHVAPAQSSALLLTDCLSKGHERRVRCDGARPSCGACCRTARHKGRRPSCVYRPPPSVEEDESERAWGAPGVDRVLATAPPAKSLEGLDTASLQWLRIKLDSQIGALHCTL